MTGARPAVGGQPAPRVLIVYDCLYPWRIGGAERWYRALAERLAGEGYAVTYLTLRQWPAPRHGRRPASAGEPEAPPMIPDVTVITAGPRLALYAGARRRLWPPVRFGVGVTWHLLRHGRDYDAVHTASFPYWPVLAAAALQGRGGYRLVVDWWEVWTRAYWRTYAGVITGTIGWLVQRVAVRVTPRAFVFSRLHAARLRAEGYRGPVTALSGVYDGPLTLPEPHRAADPILAPAAVQPAAATGPTSQTANGPAFQPTGAVPGSAVPSPVAGAPRRCLPAVARRVPAPSRTHPNPAAGRPASAPGEPQGRSRIQPAAQAFAIPTGPFLLYAGRHIPEKRVPAIIPALAVTRATIPTLTAVITGDGPTYDRLEAAIVAAKLTGAVWRPGFLADAQLDALYRAALCLMLPSQREGYGLVVVEAAARGTPSVVVAGPDNAATELIVPGVNGIIAPSVAAADLASAILAVATAGPSLRATTAAWFAANAPRLTLAGSLAEVSAAYAARAKDEAPTCPPR